MTDTQPPNGPEGPEAPISEAESRIREELEKAASLMTGARRLMAEGRTIDLSALDDRMSALGDALQAAPEEIAHDYKEHLGTLMEILDALESDLEAHHRATEDGLNRIKLRTAHDAYGPKSGPKEDT